MLRGMKHRLSLPVALQAKFGCDGFTLFEANDWVETLKLLNWRGVLPENRWKRQNRQWPGPYLDGGDLGV